MSISEKLMTIAENEQLVANANAELEEALYSVSEGGKSYYDKFWDIFQSNGQLTSYNYAFAYGKFNDETFRPKYDIRPTSAERMFAYNNNVGVGTNSLYCITDLSGCLAKAGVVLDTSQCENLNNAFYMGRGFTRIPTISFEGCNGIIGATFYGCYNLHTIDKVILKSDGTNEFSLDSWNLPFGQCIGLRNITIEGVIGNSISFWQSPLSKESIESIFDALSTTSSGKTLTLNADAVHNAFTDAEWSALIITKSNWTISLV